MTTFAAVACAPGAALAPGWRPRGPAGRAAPSAPGIPTSPAEVRAAFEAAAGRLDDLARSFRADGASSYADILDAEALVARDPTFADEAVALLGEASGEEAVTRVAERHAEVMAGLDSAELRERAADIRQVGRMVADELAGRVPPVPPDGAFVLLAEEVTAPDLLTYAGRLAGAVSVLGGAGSHASIIARSLGIPLLVGVAAAALEAADGAPLLVDGDGGTLVVEPGDAAAAAFRTRTRSLTDDELAAARALPARTVDGVDVSLLANIASSTEARRALDAGAAGVGLLRTELAFLDAAGWPTEDQHAAALRPVLEVLRGRPVTVRLLDFTNDKTPPFLVGTPASSSLARLLANDDALDAQLRALLVAGRGTGLQVLVPMVTEPAALTRGRARLARAAQAVGAASVPPLGAMLELPAAVERLPELADVGDFFSLGTNDLTASTLGLARTDPRLTPALAGHPDVLSQVERAVAVTAAAGRPLSVCGDAAADPAVLPLLLQAGVRSVSVAPARLDAVRELVRRGGVAALVRSGSEA